MNQLIVVGFDRVEDAHKAMQELRTMERSGQIHFEDTTVIERDTDGKAHVRGELSGTTEAGAVVGGIIGGLVAVVFPLAGIALGAAVGGAVGASFKSGVERDFVNDVKETLTPGRSALFLVVKDSHAGAAIHALSQFHGDVIQTTLDTDAEEALRQALE